MGYRGKVLEREEAVERGPRRVLRPREPNALERRKQAEIAELSDAGRRGSGS